MKFLNIAPYSGQIGGVLLGVGVGMQYGPTAGIAVSFIGFMQSMLLQRQHELLLRQIDHIALLRDHFIILSEMAKTGMSLEDRLDIIEKNYMP